MGAAEVERRRPRDGRLCLRGMRHADRRTTQDGHAGRWRMACHGTRRRQDRRVPHQQPVFPAGLEVLGRDRGRVSAGQGRRGAAENLCEHRPGRNLGGRIRHQAGRGRPEDPCGVLHARRRPCSSAGRHLRGGRPRQPPGRQAGGLGPRRRRLDHRPHGDLRRPRPAQGVAAAGRSDPKAGGARTGAAGQGHGHGHRQRWPLHGRGLRLLPRPQGAQRVCHQGPVAARQGTHRQADQGGSELEGPHHQVGCRGLPGGI